MTTLESVTVDDLKDIQAGPIAAVPTRASVFLFFSIKDVTQFRTLFGKVLPRITSSYVARGMRDEVYQAKVLSEMVDLAGVNVSFSQQGLDKLGFKGADLGDKAFTQGQKDRAVKELGDDLNKWLSDFKRPEEPIHGLFEVAGYPMEHVHKVAEDLIEDLSASIYVVINHCGKARTGEQKGHEHFGFNDGISQPYVKFEDDDKQQPKRKRLPGQNVVDPGVLVLGQPGEPNVQTPRPQWAKNGSFVVYRHLKQLVPEFNEFLRSAVRSEIFIGHGEGNFPVGEAELQQRADFLGARLMGRWKSGLPVVRTAKKEGEFPVDDPAIGKDPQRNNCFDYVARDPFLCPFAAHTRKTGPRSDVGPESVKKRSIRRGGITYGPELDLPTEKLVTCHPRGLSFVCYQSSVVDGFEFIQQSWCNDPTFRFELGDVKPGFDPIIGQNKGQVRPMTGYNAEELSETLELKKDFVISQGGEYFFLPSLTTLKEITQSPT